MKLAALAASALLTLPLAAEAAEITHFPAGAAPNGMAPAFSSAVKAGDTVYLSGTIDGGPQPGDTPEIVSKRVLDNLKKGADAAGVSMNDLVWVQIFATDLSWYAPFNTVYRSYFTGPLPARAFIGTSQLLNGSHFEVMGIAVKK